MPDYNGVSCFQLAGLLTKSSQLTTVNFVTVPDRDSSENTNFFGSTLRALVSRDNAASDLVEEQARRLAEATTQAVPWFALVNAGEFTVSSPS